MLMRIKLLSLLSLLAVTALAGCKDGDPTSIDERTGAVAGVAFLDRDADGVLSTPDGPAAGVVAALILQATGDTVESAITKVDGSFLIDQVPIGQYRLVARSGALGDTVEVTDISNASFTVAAADTTFRTIALGYPTVSVATARASAPGRSVVLEGVALNAWTAFGDSTVHVKDATGAIRAIRVQGTALAAGDSVRLIGTTAVHEGQPVLTAARATRLGAAVGVHPTDSISTALAASADGGSLDADQVRVGGSITGSQSAPNGDLILTVDDGTGSVEVVLDAHVSFTPGPYQPGALLRVSGVLVPTATGSWQIRPRTAADANAFYVTLSVADARALQPGQTAWVSGVALNGRNTFGDQTVHVQDGTGAIRFLNVPASPSILSGYSVRILGTAGVQNGMPVLSASSIAQVSVGTLPAVDSVSTQSAASAAGGSRDAGQVAVSGTISAVATAGGDQLLVISDGSGSLEVVLDAQVGFAAGAYQVGDAVRVRGVLVPKSTGATWQLKPRSLGEITAS